MILTIRVERSTDSLKLRELLKLATVRLSHEDVARSEVTFKTAVVELRAATVQLTVPFTSKVGGIIAIIGQ